MGSARTAMFRGYRGPSSGGSGRPRPERSPAPRSRSVWSWCVAPFARLVVVAGRRFRSPAGAAARFVAEGLVLRPPTAAEGCTDLAHAPGGHLDAQVSAQVYRSVGDELYPDWLLGLLTRTLLQLVVKRAARAATHDLGHLLRGRVLRLDPRPLLDVEDLRQATDALGEVQATPSVVEDCHARGGVRPCVGDRQFFSICRRLLAHSPSPRASQGPQGRGTHRGGAR